MINNRMRLGDLLVSVGKITYEQLKKALDEQKASGKKLGELLVDLGYITEMDMIQVLEVHLGIPHVDLEKFFIESEIPNLISENVAKRNVLIPIKKLNNKLVIAMSDPLNIFAIDDVRLATGLEVEPVISTKRNILNAIEQYYGKQNAEKAIEDFKKQYSIDTISEQEDQATRDVNNAPVVRLVNSIIKQAVKSKASDIHIEPLENYVRIRYRIDGDLQQIMTPAKSALSAIITRIKIMGSMDIAEKRLPQDGRVEANVDGREVDLRISILPTVYGEKVVIRLLDRSGFLMTKSQLGLSERNIRIFDKVIQNPNGIILVTGPTGSGKTTTLYTVLNTLNTMNKNIITVEDPVEYRLEGINQVQVNNKAGLTFASGLRSILRQDPDIIMIGEIRDAETAQIAVRAAITGHLVISTMHTNDSPSTISRLADMDIENYLIASSLVGVVAQRLVRKICNSCKISYTPSPEEKQGINIGSDTQICKGSGCKYCYNSGYSGRIAIYEIMSVTKEIRDLVTQRASIDELRKVALEQGMITLRESCKELVLQGITTFEELARVTYTNE